MARPTPIARPLAHIEALDRSRARNLRVEHARYTDLLPDMLLSTLLRRAQRCRTHGTTDEEWPQDRSARQGARVRRRTKATPPRAIALQLGGSFAVNEEHQTDR